ncbi:MAG: hypothetical protein HYU66_06735 [Armatimonadetes bacterium]|nr:hypothetical protein [Armatimonadota bacterium]
MAMRTIETVAEVTADGSLVARAPVGLAPGHHRATIVVDEAPDAGLEERRAAIMSCVGAWSDMSDEEMDEFLADIYARRRGFFGDRPDNATDPA